MIQSLLPSCITLNIHENIEYYLEKLRTYPALTDTLTSIENILKTSSIRFKPLLFIYNSLFEQAFSDNDLTKFESLLNSLLHDLKEPPPPQIFTIDQYFTPQMAKIQYNMLSRHADFNLTFSTVTNSESNIMTQYIQDGLNIINAVDHLQFETINHFVTSIIIVKSDLLKAGSTFDALGFIYMSVFPEGKDAFDALDYIIHETAHHYIYALSTVDELVLNHIDEVYSSPIRKDPRPMLGVFHAVYVLAKLCIFFKKMISQPKLHPIELSRIQERLEKYQDHYWEGMKIVDNYGRLTPMGQEVMLTKRKLMSL